MVKKKPVTKKEPVKKVVKEPVEEPVAEVVEAAPMTIIDVRDRVVGVVQDLRAVGLAAVANRGFAALEGFIAGIKGDTAKKPPKGR